MTLDQLITDYYEMLQVSQTADTDTIKRYLHRKGLVERLETGQMAISAEGVDYVEDHTLQVRSDRLLEAHNA